MTDQAPKQPGDAAVTDEEKVPRRDFLSRAGGVTLACCGLVATAGALRMTVPEVADGPPSRFAIGSVADFKMRTLTWLREHGLFVLRNEQGFGAISSRCTHLGCTVRRGADGFYCPCHGARFDAMGVVVEGPARDDLPWYKMWIEGDGVLWVDTSVQVEGQTVPMHLLRGDASEEQV